MSYSLTTTGWGTRWLLRRTWDDHGTSISIKFCTKKLQQMVSTPPHAPIILIARVFDNGMSAYWVLDEMGVGPTNNLLFVYSATMSLVDTISCCWTHNTHFDAHRHDVVVVVEIWVNEYEWFNNNNKILCFLLKQVTVLFKVTTVLIGVVQRSGVVVERNILQSTQNGFDMVITRAVHHNLVHHCHIRRV